MVMPSHKAPKLVFEGISGSGKSSAALDVAGNLSEAYPSSNINVVDSTGIHRYHQGEITSHSWPWLDNLVPEHGKKGSAMRLGAFTLLRRMADERLSRDTDLTISVRDPFRIDPATYAAIFAPGTLGKLSPERRLSIFNGITSARHPDAVVHLHTTPETEEKIHIVSEQLPKVLDRYQKIYGIPLIAVEALAPSTFSEIASRVEPFIISRPSPLQIPDAPPVYF
jgi:hypothetical protein